jgi:hypothetical protein
LDAFGIDSLVCLMANNLRNSTEEFWIDLYSRADLGGTLHRLSLVRPMVSAIFSGAKLPRFRSVIVGPGTIAKLFVRDRSEPIILRPVTILTDIALHKNAGQVSMLQLDSIGQDETAVLRAGRRNDLVTSNAT